MASAASGYRLSLGADGPPGSYELKVCAVALAKAAAA
jgi:hypothetical protein